MAIASASINRAPNRAPVTHIDSRFSSMSSVYLARTSNIPTNAVHISVLFTLLGIGFTDARTGMIHLSYSDRTVFRDYLRKVDKILLYPLRSEHSHNYACGVGHFVGGTADIEFQETSLGGIPRPLTHGGGRGNLLQYNNMWVVLPNNGLIVLPKAIILQDITKVKTAIAGNIKELEVLQEKISYLEVTGKEEYIEDEFKAFKVLREINPANSISDQIAKILALIK